MHKSVLVVLLSLFIVSSKGFYWIPQRNIQLSSSATSLVTTLDVDKKTGIVFFGGDEKKIVRWDPTTTGYTVSTNFVVERIKRITIDSAANLGYVCLTQKAFGTFPLGSAAFSITERSIESSYGSGIGACLFDFTRQRFYVGGQGGQVHEFRLTDGTRSDLISTTSNVEWADAAIDAANNNIYFLDSTKNLFRIRPTVQSIYLGNANNDRYYVAVNQFTVFIGNPNGVINFFTAGNSTVKSHITSASVGFNAFWIDPIAAQVYATYMFGSQPYLVRLYLNGEMITSTTATLSTVNVNVRATGIDVSRGYFYYSEYDSAYNVRGVQITNCDSYLNDCTGCATLATSDYCRWCNESTCRVITACNGKQDRTCQSNTTSLVVVTTSGITATSTSDQFMESQTPADDGISGGAIAGIIIGVLLGVSVIGAGVFVFFWRIRRQQNNQASANESKAESSTHYGQQLSRTSSVITTIRNIEIKERLGGGHFSDVYKGIWQSTTPVALKKLKSGQAMDEFMAEAAMLQSLNHPQIVRFLGIYSSGSDKYIVCEFMENGSLNNYLHNHASEVEQIDLLNMAKQIAAGMKYLEENNVIHRDLALRNIFITVSAKGKYVVKVGDLGLSRNLEDDYYTSKQKDLPVKWTATEVIEFGKTSSKSDCWSYGVVLWEIWSYGRVPYMGMTNQEVAEQVVNKGYRLPSPPNTPTEVYNLMLRCWDKNPNKRPSFQEIFEQLDAIYRTSCRNLGRATTESSLVYPIEKSTGSIYGSFHDNEENVYN